MSILDLPRHRRRWLRALTATVALVLSGAALTSVSFGQTAPSVATTSVGTLGKDFTVNGVVTNLNTLSRGQLMNSRMVQAVFDDENPATAVNWKYPDTGVWDAARNTNQLVAAMPSYRAKGLQMLTVGLQGGCPKCDATNGTNDSTAFNSDGSLKTAWMTRLDQVIRAADANGMVVTVSLFYQAQMPRIADNAAVLNGMDNVTDWLVAGGYKNVLVELANEINIPKNQFQRYPALTGSGIVTSIKRIQARSDGKLKVSVSYTGGVLPSASITSAVNFIILHGNGRTVDQIKTMVRTVKASTAYRAKPTPIVFNEDSTKLANMTAAITNGASWGYYDQGSNNYRDGYQAPPVNWGINTTSKTAFFNEVAENTPSPPPVVTTTTGAPRTTTTVPPTNLGLLVSRSADRSSAVALHGASLSGNVYVFSKTSSMKQVRFYLDDPTMSMPPHTTENIAPFDFAGGSTAAANPYNAGALTAGSHTMTAAVLLTTGAQQIQTATFTK